MSGNSDQYLTWNSEADFRNVQSKCLQQLESIQWLHNVNYDDNTTLQDAVALIKEGKDGGREGIRKLIPTTSQFHDWMDLAFIITVGYNRMHDPNVFTILRNRIAFIRKYML